MKRMLCLKYWVLWSKQNITAINCKKKSTIKEEKASCDQEPFQTWRTHKKEVSLFTFRMWHVHVGFDFILVWRQRGSALFHTAVRHWQAGEVTEPEQVIMWHVTVTASWHRLRARCAAGGGLSLTLSEKKPRLRRPRCTASNGLARLLFLLPPAFALRVVAPKGYLQVLCGHVSCRDAKIGHLLRDGEQRGYWAAHVDTNGSLSARWQIATWRRCQQPTPRCDAVWGSVKLFLMVLENWRVAFGRNPAKQ